VTNVVSPFQFQAIALEIPLSSENGSAPGGHGFEFQHGKPGQKFERFENRCADGHRANYGESDGLRHTNGSKK